MLFRSVFSDESKHRADKMIFQTNWKRSFNESATNFSVPINYKLRENAAYDFEFRYFRNATLEEKIALQSDLIKAVDAYIDMSMRLQGRHIRLNDNVKGMVTDMNAIVNKGSELYRNRINNNFAGFSDIIRSKLRSLEELKLPATISIFKKDKNNEVNDAMRKVVDKSIADYKQLVHNEIVNFLNADIFVLADKLLIDKYQTERVKNSIGLNLGYGGIFPQGVTGSFNNYITAPYLGVSFPFAKEFGPKFLRKTSDRKSVV